jgi:hypothetical protein
MKPRPELSAVIDNLHRWILTAPTRQRRVRSRTFWNRFRYKSRTQDRVAAVKEALTNKGIQILQPPGDIFGTEDWGDWVLVSTGELLPPRPPDSWFETMATRQFESEDEVDSFFVIHLLEALGYLEADIAQGYAVPMAAGSLQRPGHADFAVFDGANRAAVSPLLVVESKAFGKKLTVRAFTQARSYAWWLSAPYYLVTNADDLLLFEYPGVPNQSEEAVMSFKRTQLQDRWSEFAGRLHREAVIIWKAQIAEVLARTRRARFAKKMA